MHSSASAAYYLTTFAPSVYCINKSILPCLISLRRCKGNNYFPNMQAFCEINAYLLTFIVFIMLI